jgi:hypothetical protein
MRFRLRTLAYPPLALALVFLTASGKELRRPLGDIPVMAAHRVSLQPDDPARTRVGSLTYLGGVRLSSPDLGFSGYSALQVIGDRFVLLSDRGNLVRFRMGPDWRPFDIHFSDLPAGPGISALKGDRDSESLAYDPGTGKFWVGFESHNVIWRFDSAFTRGERVAYPPEMRGWPSNGGPESMTRPPDGRFVVICETARPQGPGHRDEREVLLFSGDPIRDAPRPLRLSYVPPPGYDPSDAVALPDGRLLVLVRRFAIPSLFTVKIELVDLRGAKAGDVLRGTEIADFSAPLQHDNFEGLAVAREGDSLVLWMISDDNEQWWEQTLLLKFRLNL